MYASLIRSERTGSIARCAGSGRPTKIKDTVKEIVESEMRADDERTVKELQKTLAEAGLSRTLRCRSGLGWTSRGRAYCQMIREVNKAKRLAWATENLHEAEAGFLDVIFTDETSVQMESHRRFCCRKAGEPPKNKPRYLYTSEVLVTCILLFLAGYIAWVFARVPASGLGLQTRVLTNCF